MAVRWTRRANNDLIRLHAFLEAVDPDAATRAVRSALAAVRQIAQYPRVGRRLPEFDPREVRRVIAGDYEIRYEVKATELVVLRLFHVHEDR